MSRLWAALLRPAHLPPTNPVASQRIDGWLHLLDDPDRLEEAQRALRMPAHLVPVPPIALPAVTDSEGRVLAAAVEAPDPDAPPEQAPVSVGLRGAYARRAARRSAPDGSVTPVSNHSD